MSEREEETKRKLVMLGQVGRKAERAVKGREMKRKTRKIRGCWKRKEDAGRGRERRDAERGLGDDGTCTERLKKARKERR